MRIKLAIPDRYVDGPTLEAALEATTRAATQQIRAGEAPDVRDLIESRRVRWQAEPWAEEHFDLPSVLASRGWGDCDDLAPALAASLRASGEDPGARAVVYKSAPHRWHVVTQLSDGSIADPSLWAGMRRHSGIRGATSRPMVRAGEGGLALAHDGKSWCARCDLPWPESPAHLSARSRARSPGEALARAAIGARLAGDACGSELAEAAEVAADDLLEHVGFLPGAMLWAAEEMYKDASGKLKPSGERYDPLPGESWVQYAQRKAREGEAPAAAPAAAAPGGPPAATPGNVYALPGGATMVLGPDGRTLVVRF